jgi:hypothetical protein
MKTLQILFAFLIFVNTVASLTSALGSSSFSNNNHREFVRSGLIAAKTKQNNKKPRSSFSTNPVEAIGALIVSEKEIDEFIQSSNKRFENNNNNNNKNNNNINNVQDAAASPPSCITNSDGALFSGNFYTAPYGSFGDYGSYSKCNSVPDLSWCAAEASIQCYNSITQTSYQYPHNLYCNGAYWDNAIGACYNTSQCPTQSLLDGQFANWSYAIKDITAFTMFKTCYGLELVYRYGTPEGIAQFLEECNPLYSYLLFKTWCGAKDPVPEAQKDTANARAIMISLLVIVSFAALATLVGLLRRCFAGYRADFQNDDEVVNITLASQEGRRGPKSRDQLTLLDRLLYGEAELYTTAQDKDQMEQAAASQNNNNNANSNNKDEDFYITQLNTDDPDRAFRRTLGLYGGNEGNGSAAYRNNDDENNNNSEGCSCCSCSCECSSSSSRCWRAFTSSVVAWFDAFDVVSGLKEFLAPMSRQVPTQFMDGLRCAAMFLVVAGHTVWFPNQFGAFQNTNDVKSFLLSYQSVTLLPALLAVDTFFYLSGFLSMHLMSKQFERISKSKDKYAGIRVASVDYNTSASAPARSGGHDNSSCSVGGCCSGFTTTLTVILVAYVNRYLRLAPTLMVVIAITAWLLPLAVQGPLSRIVTQQQENIGCKEYFWAQATFWYGYDYDKFSCIPWIWYLSCDIIYFAFVPVVAAIDHGLRQKNFSLRWVMPVVIFLLCGFLYGWAIHQHPITKAYQESDGTFVTGYLRAIDRATPFALGSLTSLLSNLPNVHEFFEKSKTACWVAYGVAASLALAIWNVVWYTLKVFYGEGANQVSDPLMYGMHSLYFLWGVPLLLITLPALSGYKCFFTNFFGHPFFSIAGKLTYGMYLCHPIIISYFTAEAFEFSNFHRFKYYVDIGGNVFMSSIAALVLFVLVDRPIGKFCNWMSGLFGIRKGKRF